MNVTITIKSDANANAVFELVKTLGVMGASLQGNTITGSAAPNLVNPLRSVTGIESVSTNEQEPTAKQPNPQGASTGVGNPATPNLSPLPPQPEPAKINNPAPVYPNQNQ